MPGVLLCEAGPAWGVDESPPASPPANSTGLRGERGTALMDVGSTGPCNGMRLTAWGEDRLLLITVSDGVSLPTHTAAGFQFWKTHLSPLNPTLISVLKNKPGLWLSEHGGLPLSQHSGGRGRWDL